MGNFKCVLFLSENFQLGDPGGQYGQYYYQKTSAEQTKPKTNYPTNSSGYKSGHMEVRNNTGCLITKETLGFDGIIFTKSQSSLSPSF